MLQFLNSYIWIMPTPGLKIEFLIHPRSKHRDLVKILEDWKYKPSDTFFWKKHIIPKGFINDFASVPDSLSWFIHPNDKRTRNASIFHDYGYRNQEELIEMYWDTLAGFSHSQKKESLRYKLNKEMKLKCIQDGLSKWKANIIFFAIHHTPIAKKIWKKGGIIDEF